MKHRCHYPLADYQAFLPAEFSIFATNVPVPGTPTHRTLRSVPWLPSDTHNFTSVFEAYAPLDFEILRSACGLLTVLVRVPAPERLLNG